MAKKKSQIDRAIENLEGEKAGIDKLIQKLREQLTATAPKPRKAKARTAQAVDAARPAAEGASR